MSEKIFEKVTFNSDFDLGHDFISTVLRYALPHAVSDLGCYWRNSDAEKIINNDTFGFIWDNYPDTRGELLTVICNISSSSTRIESLTKEFSVNAAKHIFDAIEDNEEIEDNDLKIRLLPIVDPSFDYLTKLCEFALDSEKKNLYERWRNAGLNSSMDSAFYDYLWSKVKRQKGSVQIKLNILDHAFGNESVSDSLLKKIAKSSPKNVKRLTTDRLSRQIADQKYQIERLERKNTQDSLETAAYYQKKVDETERKIILFVDCTDREVVSNLLDCLSKDNLPWLMPSASKHYYLANRLQRMIDSD
ncbi:hypothetical protein CMI47_09270 [Candidatus Pacearchaeota archaeon]|nr:hypothetical protein [Candidatus Pacearchaeota archaeon]|tara:strand:+ start:225 stop:1136 length:912 start_codon:yes stop_codon:yes gene_type:complete